MVYIDRGEVLCTADKRRFVLKGGELTFHKPNEFHAIRAGENTAPNVSIITFECKSRAMHYFEGKIFRLSSEERALLSMLFREGLSAYQLVDKRNPLLQRLEKVEDPPFGSSQMTKNLLEIFLISLHRNTDVLAKRSRYHYKINGVDIPLQVKEILDLLEKNVYGSLTVEEIAKAVNKSVSTVKNLFALYREGGVIRYYNKITGESDIFCFDPLCRHNSCVARLFSDPSQLAYCAFDGQLYGTPTSAGVRDGRPFGNDNLYRIDLDTMEITCVFEGDGNELYDVSAYDEYILFRRVGEGGKRELFRYDVTQEACEAISLGEEQKIGKLWVCGQDIFVSFANELELYRTDEDFSFFENTGVLGHAFVSEKGVYWSEPDRDGNQSTAVYEGNLQTGATREIGTYPYRFEFQGFDDTYLYVCIYGCEVPRADARSSVLHRIDIRTGALERMLDCSEDGYILGVHMDGERLFLHQRRVQTDANADHTFWYLTQNTKGEWEKHSIFGKQGE
jgi:hypothetical protein